MHPDMRQKLLSFFLNSSTALLLLMGIAKVLSSAGGAPSLRAADPILTLPIRHVLWIVGVIELMVAAACLCGKAPKLKVLLLAWLATLFGVYRLGLLWIGYNGPCRCMGNLTEVLHVPSKTADTVTKLILAYLLIGSYSMLLWLWKEKRVCSKISA